MVKKKSTFKLTEEGIRIILVILGSVFSTVVLFFSVMALIAVQDGQIEKASTSILIIFILLGLSRLVTFLKTRTRISFWRFFILLLFDIALGIVGYFGKEHTYLYSLAGGLFCLTVILSRLIIIAQNKTLRSLVLNLIIIAGFGFLAAGLFIPNAGDKEYTPVIITCFIVVLTALMEVLSNAFSQLKFKVLFKIIFRTYALEIILGLLTMIVASALVYTYYEAEMEGNFGNGLWFAFTVVTTIGFGDMKVTTLPGRLVTVVLGIYGIIVVAVITSIIVNFYNETAGKKDAKQIKNIKDEEKKK